MTRRDHILEIVRQSLESGKKVEIEGLGTFRPSPAGGYRFEPETRPLIFVAYVAEDIKLARRVCDSLARAGCSAWLDKDKLLPGQNWPRAIERAIEMADAVVVCFSPRSLVKRGQFQSELRYALDCARRVPLDAEFLIPVRLRPCEVPARISDQVQYVDLFPDWERGMNRVIRAARKSARRRQPPSLCA